MLALSCTMHRFVLKVCSFFFLHSESEENDMPKRDMSPDLNYICLEISVHYGDIIKKFGWLPT